MNIDQLISMCKDLANASGGTLVTSTSLSNNPDVCHAACLWFLHNIQRSDLQEVITQLEYMDKNTLRKTQDGVVAGPRMPKAMLGQAFSSGRMIGFDDRQAIKYAIDYWQQPDTYTYSIHDFASEVVDKMRSARSGADRVLIYMTPDKDGPGHVICITRYVGGIVIYDPNIGVLTFKLSSATTWQGVLATILNWYKQHLDLTRVGLT